MSVCFYGDLFRQDPETLDEEKWQASRAGTSEMLESFAGTSGLDAVSQAASAAAFDRTVDLVTVLANDASVAHTARSRLLKLIGAETQVLVAHSLGTLLSYNTLVDHPEVSVGTLVTLGSPLGSSMTDAMLPAAGKDGLRPFPEGIQRWVNVAAVGDVATGNGQLAPRFGSVEDRRVDNGHRAHDPEPYLNNPITGEAVSKALAS